MTDTDTCPCNSHKPYTECCGPLLSGIRLADTAEALMRSRYSAYVVRDIAYLLRSWHPSTRPDKIDPVAIPAWYELIIIHTEKGQETDNEGVVEFQAAAFSQKSILRLHEVSRFVKENNQWFYVDGEIKDDSHPVEGHEPKVGRNSPCPCGSGRKFKKCCGR